MEKNTLADQKESFCTKPKIGSNRPVSVRFDVGFFLPNPFKPKLFLLSFF
jgi:hypothetical protein